MKLSNFILRGKKPTSAQPTSWDINYNNKKRVVPPVPGGRRALALYSNPLPRQTVQLKKGGLGISAFEEHCKQNVIL